MASDKVPMEFISTCSKNSLQSFELARLAAASELRRQVIDLADEWIEAEVEARIARWVLANHERNPGLRVGEIVGAAAFPVSLKTLLPPSARDRGTGGLLASGEIESHREGSLLALPSPMPAPPLRTARIPAATRSSRSSSREAGAALGEICSNGLAKSPELDNASNAASPGCAAHNSSSRVARGAVASSDQKPTLRTFSDTLVRRSRLLRMRRLVRVRGHRL